MNHYTPRVAARTVVAKTILDKYLQAAKQVGITKADLEIIVDQGQKAAKADEEQQEQLAAAQVNRALQKNIKDALFAEEDALRNRLPAIIGDLSASTDEQTQRLALWLDRLSFARYRFRILPSEAKEPSTSEEEEEIRKVKRVQREDISSRASALVSFCQAILKPGREAILSAFEARGLPKSDFEKLINDGQAVAEVGLNALQAAEATQREIEAVAAQKAKWNQVRRMIRALAAKEPEIKQKFAGC